MWLAIHDVSKVNRVSKSGPRIENLITLHRSEVIFQSSDTSRINVVYHNSHNKLDN